MDLTWLRLYHVGNGKKVSDLSLLSRLKLWECGDSNLEQDVCLRESWHSQGRRLRDDKS